VHMPACAAVVPFTVRLGGQSAL